MPASPLRDIDLNLLVALEALLRTCSVTAAARELGLTQSAVSHSLAHLRKVFGDPLLVRSNNQMVPTAKGRSLLLPTQRILFDAERLVAPGSDGGSALLRRSFTVLSTDYPQLLVLLPLVERLRGHAPDASLELRYLTTLLPDRELDAGTVDVCVANMPFDLPSHLHRRTLFHDRVVVVARAGHPELRGGLDMELYQRLGQVVFLSRGAPIFHAVLERKPAVHREKRVSVANLGLVPRVVSASDYVATIPQRAALLFRESHALELYECPFEVALYPVEMIWHQRDDADEGHSWFRAALVEIGAAIETEPLAGARASRDALRASTTSIRHRAR